MTRLLTKVPCTIGHLLLVGSVVFGPVPALAQRLELTPPPPERRSERTIPAPLPGDFSPTPQSFAYLPPLSKGAETSRGGLAAWTAPNARVGSRGLEDPARAGWLGFGFAVEWGRPAGRTGTN